MAKAWQLGGARVQPAFRMHGRQFQSRHHKALRTETLTAPISGGGTNAPFNLRRNPITRHDQHPPRRRKPRRVRSRDGEAVVAPDDSCEANERADARPRRRRTAIGRISQRVLAILYVVAAAILINEILSPGAVSARRRVLFAVPVGLMFLLAVVHLVIYRLGSKLPKGAACPLPSPPERIR